MKHRAPILKTLGLLLRLAPRAGGASFPELPLAVAEPENLKALQMERLTEIMAHSNASGAAIIIEEGSRPKVAFQKGLLSVVSDQVIEALKMKEAPLPGLLFSRPAASWSLHLFLLTDQCPEKARVLIDLYLIVWSELYLRGAIALKESP